MACLYGSVHYGGIRPVDADARQDIGGIVEMVPIPANHSHIPPAAFPDGILMEQEADEMAVFGQFHADEIGNNCHFSYIGCLSRHQSAQLPQPTDDLARVLLGH